MAETQSERYRDTIRYLASRPYVVYEAIEIVCNLYDKSGPDVVQDIGLARVKLAPDQSTSLG